MSLKTSVGAGIISRERYPTLSHRRDYLRYPNTRSKPLSMASIPLWTPFVLGKSNFRMSSLTKMEIYRRCMQLQCAWQEAVQFELFQFFFEKQAPRRGFGVFNLPLTLYNLCSAVDLFTPSDYFIGGQIHPHNPRTLTLERYYWHPSSLKPFLSVQISDPSRHQVYLQARSMCPQFYRDAKLWGGASQLQLIYRSTLQYFQLTIPHSQRDTCPLLKFFNCRPSINL